MADKLLLHELLKEEQEPFHLKSYIADRKSQLKKPTLQLQKRRPIPKKRTNNLTRHACFLSFQNSPDVTKSPFLSPAKSPSNAVFLHIPSRTAGLLVEAAMRIQKQQKPQPKISGFGIFGSLLKRLNRSKSKKRAIGNSDFKASDQNATRVEETVRLSCSCSNRRLSSGDWTDNNEDKSMDFEASSSGYWEDINSEFGFSATRFCASPFVFSLHRSPSSSGRRTPDFCSPPVSPNRRLKQEKDNYETQNSGNIRGDEEEEEKEQCSPVSVLDTPFEDDGHESEDAEEDDDDYDDDVDCGYENLERAKEQLLYRLRRFEKLAELDPMALEKKLLEKSDEEDQEDECEALDDGEPLSMYERLVSDLIVEEKSETIHSTASHDAVMGRVSKRFDSWKEVEFNTIDMMVGLDLKRGLDGWTKFDEEVEETAEEIEHEIYVLLIEELYDELM